jgi:hypothetical protein
VTEPHAWPLEQSARGTLRPWAATAAGYLAVVFADPDEAERARRGLQQRGVPEGDLRLYDAQETLAIAARLQHERSVLAKAINQVVADRSLRDRWLDNARAGGSLLWIYAPTEDRADRLVGLLADYRYGTLRYFGDKGVEDVAGDAG